MHSAPLTAKEARERFPAIAELWDWSHNYLAERSKVPASPFHVFRDLCGHSEITQGEETGCFMPVGTHDLALLGDALSCFNNHGLQEVYNAIEALMEVHDE